MKKKSSSLFNNKRIFLEIIDSTNNYALELIKNNNSLEGTVVATSFQSQGRGQRGRCWESEPLQNLLLSIILQPNIDISQQFRLNICMSLALTDCLQNYFKDGIKIKWPNDILLHQHKISGILIQNKVFRRRVAYSVIGIGVNINQAKFQDYLPKATSFFIQKNRKSSIQDIENNLLSNVDSRYKEFQQFDYKKQLNNYLDHLYLKDIASEFILKNEKIKGIIRGVSESGKLLLEREDKIVEGFNMNDIQFIF